MRSALDAESLRTYVARQLNAFFPLPRSIEPEELRVAVEAALGRVERCFRYVALPGWHTPDGEALFDPLHTDKYCIFLLYLANALWNADGFPDRAARVFALNKALHGLNCVYDTPLPDVFVVAHPVGSVIGKAVLRNGLVVVQGVTIGAIGGIFPTLSEGLVLSAGASIIGRCTIGRNVLLEPYTAVVKTDLPPDTRVGGALGAYVFTPQGDRALRNYFEPLPGEPEAQSPGE